MLLINLFTYLEVRVKNSKRENGYTGQELHLGVLRKRQGAKPVGHHLPLFPGASSRSWKRSGAAPVCWDTSVTGCSFTHYGTTPAPEILMLQSLPTFSYQTLNTCQVLGFHQNNSRLLFKGKSPWLFQPGAEFGEFVQIHHLLDAN